MANDDDIRLLVEQEKALVLPEFSEAIAFALGSALRAAALAGGYGIVADLVLGLIGAVVGGLVSGMLIAGEAGFWASLLIAFIGACMVIAVARIFAPARTGRV